MGCIKTYLDRSRDLSVIEAIGDVGCEDFVIAVKKQASEYITADIMILLSDGDMSNIAADDFTKLTDVAKESWQARGQARTVFVTGGAMNALFSKLYSATASITGSPISYKIVETRAEAFAWLDQN